MSRTDDAPILALINVGIFLVAVGTGWALADALIRARDRWLARGS